jgi:hypothetical protein
VYQYQMPQAPVMTSQQAKQGHYNPKAFFPTETYCVWNTASNCPVQSEGSAAGGEYACGILNNHEIKNGRPAVYVWFQFAAPVRTGQV